MGEFEIETPTPRTSDIVVLEWDDDALAAQDRFESLERELQAAHLTCLAAI